MSESVQAKAGQKGETGDAVPSMAGVIERTARRAVLNVEADFSSSSSSAAAASSSSTSKGAPASLAAAEGYAELPARALSASDVHDVMDERSESSEEKTCWLEDERDREWCVALPWPLRFIDSWRGGEDSSPSSCVERRADMAHSGRGEDDVSEMGEREESDKERWRHDEPMLT